MAAVLSEKQRERRGRKSILKASESLPKGTPKVRGYDFNNGLDYKRLLDSYAATGFQATQFARAVDIVREMRKGRATIYLGYTSNMVSSGLREIIRYLAEHKLVDIIVTSAGGIEEDFIKCFGDFGVIEGFRADDAGLREKGINRMGNLLVPNELYCAFEDFVNPILTKLADEQEKTGTIHTPSEVIRALGESISSKSPNFKESIYHWCAKNDIPVFCPEITDGSLGDMIHFFAYKRKEFKIDVVRDIHRLNDFTMKQKRTGIIILGAGVPKHHICNTNLMREGADFAVYINNESEYDGSNAGAGPEEAVSWGKIAGKGKAVKVFGDAILLFPLIVAKGFVE